jgi:hypothetical protein
MKSNVPPGAAEDPTAPYNEKFKVIEVNVSQCLSANVEIKVPEDFDETDNIALTNIVYEQIVLPSELTVEHSPDCWYVDDFCVCL